MTSDPKDNRKESEEPKDNLKSEEHKKFLRVQKCSNVEEWIGELTDAKSRRPGVRPVGGNYTRLGHGVILLEVDSVITEKYVLVKIPNFR